MHVKKERRCVACRENKQQADMLRVTHINHEFLIDINQKLGGRGAYVCKNSNCIALTIKKKLFNRAYKQNINDELYIKLGEYEKNN